MYERLRSLGVVQRFIRRLPVSVGEPHGVSRHSVAVLVAVPRVVRVRPVLDVQDGVPEARLPEGRVARLRRRHAALYIFFSQQLHMMSCQRSGTENSWWKRKKDSYLVASPSWFPPSPMVM